MGVRVSNECGPLARLHPNAGGFGRSRSRGPEGNEQREAVLAAQRTTVGDLGKSTERAPPIPSTGIRRPQLEPRAWRRTYKELESCAVGTTGIRYVACI